MHDVYRFSYDPVDSNMFFIPCGDTGIIIDPNESEELLDIINKYKTQRVRVLITHEHFDHTSGIPWLLSKIECTLMCQQKCADSVAAPKGRGNNPVLVALVLAERDRKDGGNRYKVFKKTTQRFSFTVDSVFYDDCIIQVGDLSVNCKATPGHTTGSAVYLMGDNCIFTGDSLIQNSPTILRFPESDKVLYNEVTLPFLKSLDKNMLVFPGHGEPFKICESKYL